MGFQFKNALLQWGEKVLHMVFVKARCDVLGAVPIEARDPYYEDAFHAFMGPG